MTIRNYERLNEHVITERLNNGLTIHMIPKNDYHKTFGMIYTDFGSIDNTFMPRGKKEYKTNPYGMAHFLEHTLFIKKEGDVFHEFSKQGASANAFTSHSKTAYQFSTTEQVKENIITLLDFVQKPYFSEETVEKEKKIISQEIKLYKDDPDSTLVLGLAENLYPHHPVHIDIAGTEESIKEITPELLYEAHDYFYQPSNMTLILVGKLNPSETLQWIEDNQRAKSFASYQPILRKEVKDDVPLILPFKETSMQVNKPKALLGIRGDKHKLTGKEGLRHLILMDLLLKMMFGETSSTYLTLYDEGIIDDSFQFNYTWDRSFDYISLGGDTLDPSRLVDAIKTVCFNYEWNPDINAEHFSLVKKSTIGQVLQSMNSLEFIAHQWVDYDFKDVSIYDTLEIVESTRLEEVKALAASYFKETNSSVYVMNKE